MRPNLFAVPVGDRQVETWGFLAVMPFQYFDVWLIVIGKLAIGAVAYTRAFAIIPDKAVARVASVAGTFGIIVATAITIAGGPGFFDKICGISGGAPVVAISANLCVYIKIVQ